MNNITHRALCEFRNAKAAEAVSLLAALSSATGDARWITMDKAIRAAEDSAAAHAELDAAFGNPCDTIDPYLLVLMKAHLGDKADDAYARAEAVMEDRDLSSFHEAAFGDAA